MMGLRLFGQRSFLEPELESWQLDTWKSLLTHFGGMQRLQNSPLVVASREFFPPTEATGHERAQHVFECVKTQAGMADWPCNLLAQPDGPNMRVGEFAILKFTGGKAPLGTFAVDGNMPTVTYDPTSIKEPAVLVATLVHELAHYRLMAVRDDMPGGDEMHEFATDLMTAFLGFGLFGANRAFTFSQHGDSISQGWQWSRQGYLRERDWAFALAVFLDLRGQMPETLKKLLKPHLYADLTKAARYLRRNPSLLEKHRRIER
ncbi:MAG: hypothetical protein ABSC92_15290 [Rhizomicrobium sp.]|jgi:hypothetical protein